MGAVRVEGLAELRRALRRCEGTLQKGVTEALKDSASIVAHEVERRAPVRTGRLVRPVRSFTQGTTAGVRVNAVRVSPRYPGGYPYPRRIEFEGSGGSRSGAGRRAFMAPALEAKRDEVVRRMSFVLDDVREAWEVGA